MAYDNSGGESDPSFVDPDSLGGDLSPPGSDIQLKCDEIMVQLQAIESFIHGLTHTQKTLSMRLSSFSDSLISIKKLQEGSLPEVDAQLKTIQKAVDKIAHVVSNLNLGEPPPSKEGQQEVTEMFAKVVRRLFLEMTRQAFLCRLGSFDFSINRVVLVNFLFSLCLLVYLGIFSFAATVRLNRLEYRLQRFTEQLKSPSRL